MYLHYMGDILRVNFFLLIQQLAKYWYCNHLFRNTITFSKISMHHKNMGIWERKKEFVVLGFYIFKNRRKDFHLDIVIVWILYGYGRREEFGLLLMRLNRRWKICEKRTVLHVDPRITRRIRSNVRLIRILEWKFY